MRASVGRRKYAGYVTWESMGRWQWGTDLDCQFKSGGLLAGRTSPWERPFLVTSSLAFSIAIVEGADGELQCFLPQSPGFTGNVCEQFAERFTSVPPSYRKRLMIRNSLPAAAIALLTLAPAIVNARSEEATIRESREVLQQFLDLQIRQIPDSLLSEAQGVAIIPAVIKLGFVVGGQRGHGVVVIRERDGSWRAPLFVTITGGSVGWQVGAQSTDFVLVFKSQKSVEGLLRGKFTLGADAAVAAGPVGRRAGAATDTQLQAEIYSYSRSRGLFAGVSLEGSALQVDDAANTAYYGMGVAGGPPPVVPAAALSLVETIARLTSQPATIPTGPAATLAPPPTGALEPTTIVSRTVSDQHLDLLQNQLVQSSTRLNPLLDEQWRQYLALPGDVYQPGQRPSLQTLEAALARYNAVAANRQYQSLTDRPEFHATHQVLQSLCEDLRATGGGALNLGPPPLVQP